MKTIRLGLIALGVVIFAGCPSSTPTTLPPATEGGGFLLETVLVSSAGVTAPVGGIEINGTWVRDGYNAAGDPNPIQGAAGLSSFQPIGLIDANGKRAPATWAFKWVSGGPPICSQFPAIQVVIPLNSLTALLCEPGSFGFGPFFAFNPNPVMTYAPPSQGTITGSGMRGTYALPLVQYYSMSGTLIAQEHANYVSSDGTRITLPGGDISNLQPGGYAGFISNANSDGSYTDVGVASVVVNGPVDWGCCYSVANGDWNSTYYFPENLGHPYARVTNAYVASGDAIDWYVNVSQQYHPYPTLVPAASIVFSPSNVGYSMAIIHIDLSDGASFDFEYTATAVN